jgi:hypothetical protein
MCEKIKKYIKEKQEEIEKEINVLKTQPIIYRDLINQMIGRKSMLIMIELLLEEK